MQHVYIKLSEGLREETVDPQTTECEIAWIHTIIYGRGAFQSWSVSLVAKN